jgi:hypothetical protein
MADEEEKDVKDVGGKKEVVCTALEVEYCGGTFVAFVSCHRFLCFFE